MRLLLTFLLAAFLLPLPARAIVDLDSDGWSDLWEAKYGRGYVKGDDDDHDGRTNWEEHNDGTDPRDAASVRPEPTWTQLPAGKHQFTWPTVAGKVYQLQVSFDGTNWAGIGAPVLGTGGTIERTFDQASTFLGTGPLMSRYTNLADKSPITAIKAAIRARLSPEEETLLPDFVETPQSSPNLSHFGQYIRGWIIPPATGSYIFWVSGDDVTEFSLSTNVAPRLKRVRAYNGAYTNFRQFGRYPTQQSVSIPLVAGHLYYFELYSQEFGGADHVSLAWTGPGLNPDKEIIAGSCVASSTETLLRKLASNPNPQWRLQVSDRDADGDGLTDYEEMIVGLDPTNPKTTSRTPDLTTVTNMFSATNIVTVGVDAPHAYEAEQQPARFTFFRTGNLNTFSAHFSLTGTAQTGVDYAPLSGTVLFGVGQTSATVELLPTNDGQFEQAETVTATIDPDAAYQVGTPSSATVSIDDAAELVFVATMKAASGPSGGYGSAGLHMVGNKAFADLSVSFGNLTSPATGVQLVVLQSGAAPVPVLSLPADQLDAFHWVLADAGGFTKDQIVAALLAGNLGARVNTEAVPDGEIIAPFLKNWGWKTLPVPPSPGAALTRAQTDGEAARFLTQATFGPTEADIQLVRRIGYAAWINAQLATPPTLHLPYVRARRAQLKARNKGDDGYQTPRQEAWWQAALAGHDQLRQRMAFALSEIIVVSDVGVLSNAHEGMANWYDLMVRHAFGNYRNLLQDITVSPMMGQYLSMARNQKPNANTGAEPDENYAREIMQLFSVGLSMLNRDGSLALDANGLPVPTYSQNDIVGLAHVFTGWGPYYNPAKPPKDRNGYYRYNELPQLNPMVFYPEFHDTKPKHILAGTTIPSGMDGAAELKLVLDSIFNHPNVAPFISRQLIQRLVTSNPSRGYVYRVASAFENNGRGVRGDLAATARAILLDPEARNPVFLDSDAYGKLREPLLRVSALMRAFRPAPSLPGDPRYFVDNQYNLDVEAPLKAPTVFNFFHPRYVPPGPLADAGLVGPEFEITQETAVISVTNFLHNLIQGGIYTREQNAAKKNVYYRLNIESLIALLSRAGQPAETNQEAVITKLNDLLLGGRGSVGQLQAIRDAWAALPSNFGDSHDRQQDRIRLAIYIITASPEFATQR